MCRSSALVLTVVAALTVGACATIIQGTSQGLGVSSSPTGARVIIDNQPAGTTPVIADLKRKDNHSVRIELEGYEPFEMAVTRKVSGWVFGNIIFGGLIGLAVDAISGGMYKLTPEQVQGMLVERKVGIEQTEDALYLTVVLTPAPSWERVGTLERTR